MMSVINRYQIVNGRVEEIVHVNVHEFSISDVDDPILYASEPLYNWENSDQGQWVKQHALEQPSWQSMMDHSIMGTRFCIRAKLYAKDYTYYLLKWGSKK
jgi:hypothetical protein